MAEARRTDEGSCTARHDDPDVLADPPQAGEVEVVLVGVRDDDRVDGCDAEVRRLPATTYGPDTAREERVEQQPDA